MESSVTCASATFLALYAMLQEVKKLAAAGTLASLRVRLLLISGAAWVCSYKGAMQPSLETVFLHRLTPLLMAYCN